MDLFRFLPLALSSLMHLLTHLLIRLSFIHFTKPFHLWKTLPVLPNPASKLLTGLETWGRLRNSASLFHW